MGNIGEIIEKYRQASGMSRKELADNICSEKYIYLIEKGERSPSVSMLKLLGDKLAVNLFEFYAFLDCSNPMEVREKIRQFIIHRINFDFDSLKNISMEAETMLDFKNKPWSYEIEINNLYCMVYGEKRFKESLPQLEEILKDAEGKDLDELFLVNVYAMISVCYVVVGRKKNAKDAAQAAYEIFCGKHEGNIYNHFVDRIIVNIMVAYYFNGDYNEVIEIGKKVLNIKKDKYSYSRIHFIFFFMALAYYEKKMPKEAIQYLNKSIYMLMSEYKPTDVSYIAIFDRFREMLDDLDANSKIIMEFRKRYNI